MLGELLTTSWKPYRYHALQNKLWRTTARFPVVVAGRGSGKTDMARMKMVRWLPVIKDWPDPIYCFCLPTYAQASRLAWDKIVALIPSDWEPKVNKSELHITTKFGSRLYVVGMDRPARIEGMQVDGVVFDESSDQRPEAFTRSVLPMLTHRRGWCMRIGVPKRNGIGAAQFKEAYDAGCLPNKIGLESYTWASSDILTPDQLEAERAQMSEKDAEEQFGGVWVEQEGQIYYSFKDCDKSLGGNLSDECCYEENEIIGVGSDFNVNPMAWVIFHYSGGIFRVFDEIYIQNTNTQATLNELNSRYPTHKAGWRFYGDASSRNRHTSTSVTDFVQIENDGRFLRKVVTYPDANPAILDRYAAVNALFCNANKRRRLFIHPKCKNLRSDLLSCTYKEGTREMDTTDKKRGHITDALGYPIHSLIPLQMINTGMGKVSTT
jgi:hypothetical protein